MTNVRPLLSREQMTLLTIERKLPRSRAEAISFRCRVRELVDDLEGAGDEGLFWAAARYSATEGTAFRPFAQVVIDRAILSFLRRELRHRRLEAAGYVVAAWGASQVFPRSDDELRALEDGEEEALAKLHRYVDLKVLAGVAALCAEAEDRREGGERSAQLASLVSDLRKEVALLTADEQRMFIGIFWQGKTVEEAGREIGVSPVTAKRRIRGILGKLRAVLQSKGHEGIDD